MEITLDIPLIRGILRQERAQTSQEIRDLGVLGALERSQLRISAR